MPISRVPQKVVESQMADEQARFSQGCFFCKSGKDADVVRHFNRVFPGGRAVAPTRTKIIRTRDAAVETRVPLLPGYVFFQIGEDGKQASDATDAVLQALLEFSRIDSVLKLLRYSDGSWKLFGSDARFARMLFDTTGNIGLSQAYFDKGDRIRILNGFLKDYEGYITSVNRKNKTVKVTLDLQGKKVFMQLGYELVERL